jgi:excisionase family DNA binding protein
MLIEEAIREIVEQIVEERLGTASLDPELITVEQAADLCGCDKSVIHQLVHDREVNGFPAVVLGKRTIRIDKRRLQRWFQQGGLGAKE